MPALRAAATLHRDQSVRDRLAAGRDVHGREAVVDISGQQEQGGGPPPFLQKKGEEGGGVTSGRWDRASLAL